MSRTLIVKDGDVQDVSRSEQAEASRLARQRVAVQDLFTVGNKREVVMCSENWFLREVKTLHPLMRKAGRAVDAARDELARAFYYLEQDVTHRAFEVWPEVYEEMSKLFTKIADHMEAKDIITEHLQTW